MIQAKVSGIFVGDAYPVAVVGAINVSPDSFYKVLRLSLASLGLLCTGKPFPLKNLGEAHSSIGFQKIFHR